MAAANSIGIGHSNGCAILTSAAEHGALFHKLILINPALEKDIEFHHSISEIHVFHTKHDLPVVLSRWLNKLLPIPRFIWGEMGNTGYVGNDKRVINYDISCFSNGHSDAFSDKNILTLGEMLKEII